MQYNFSTLFNDKALLNDFIESYTNCVDIGDHEKMDKVIEHYDEILKLFQQDFNSQELLTLFENLAHLRVSNEMPYVIVSNEIHALKTLLLSNMQSHNINTNIINLLTLFKEVNNKVAHIYLLQYIDKLISMNNVRRNSLSDLVEKNIIKHYESHLIWLTNLAIHIKDTSFVSFPEVDHTMCDFGKWLNGDAKSIIQNNSKYNSIQSIHKSLHLFAQKIFNVLSKHEYHILLTYLEKCELISLSIGTELALLDQIQLNQRVTKDTMTGALNRQALRNVFESQYELALATSNSFILAMCDLDFFKNINDTYGHIAGDKILKLFVDITKENIRNSDVIVRYGGEEFIIMLPTIKRAKGENILEKIRCAFEESRLEFNGDSIQTTVSIGMIEIEPKDAFKSGFIDEYMMRVDQKLYLAKANGRNRVEIG